jgi:uncharacterized membrane protein
VASLTVWKFNVVDGADGALAKLEGLQKERLIQINDAAVVRWEEGKRKPKTRQMLDMTTAGGVGGAFWGLLFGLIFFVPLLGMAVGAATGALAGHFTNVGIDDDFIKTVRDNVTPGTSALFLLSSDAVLDRVRAAFPEHLDAELIKTNMSAEQEAALREAFEEE